jgi:hypothetical protein
MPTINEEIDEVWRRVAKENGAELPPITDMAAFLDEVAQESASIGRPKLEPWVSILETGILWLTHLYISLDYISLHGETQRSPSNRLYVAWALTDFACSQAVAIHRLCLSGLDPAAKGCLRSLIEALTVSIVCITDEELATRFLKAQDFDEARHLWYPELSPKKLSVRLDSIIRSFGLDDEVSAGVRAWIHEELELASQVVHVSYPAAVFAGRAKHVDGQMMHPAIFGWPTRFSVRTLATAVKTIWFFSRFGFNLLMRPQTAGSQSIHRLNANDENDRTVALGYYVFNELVDNHWQDDLLPLPEDSAGAR